MEGSLAPSIEIDFMICLSGIAVPDVARKVEERPLG
jgi:hypothetical protein